MKKMQFTFYNPTRQYMPITATITIKDTKEKISSLYNRAIEKVCIERGWTIKELVNIYGYTKYRYRLLKED